MRDIIRKKIIFYGRVQGVGFRYRAYYSAREFGLTGYVMNQYDGSVEMEVQGTKECIDEMIGQILDGRFIVVEGMDAKEIPVDNDERQFIIRD